MRRARCRCWVRWVDVGEGGGRGGRGGEDAFAPTTRPCLGSGRGRCRGGCGGGHGWLSGWRWPGRVGVYPDRRRCGFFWMRFGRSFGRLGDGGLADSVVRGGTGCACARTRGRLTPRQSINQSVNQSFSLTGRRPSHQQACEGQRDWHAHHVQSRTTHTSNENTLPKHSIRRAPLEGREGASSIETAGRGALWRRIRKEGW